MTEVAKKPKIPAKNPEILPAEPEISESGADYSLLILAVALGGLAIYIIRRRNNAGRAARAIGEAISDSLNEQESMKTPVLDRAMSGFRR